MIDRSIEYVSSAKSIAVEHIRSLELSNATKFGLPEADDRYHLWRVPIIEGDIVQMSTAFWIKEVANILKDRIGFDHLLLRLSNEDSLEYIRSRMANIEISRFS